MNVTASIAHSLIKAATRADYHRFIESGRRMREEQCPILLRILRTNAHTAFGNEHGFAGINDIESYQRAVPVRSYEELSSYLRTAMDTSEPALTEQRPLVFQPTSGTSLHVKYIPYTAALQQEYARGINVWLHDLYRMYPAILRGTHYWSISPQEDRTQTTPGGTRIGFQDDAQYLGWKGAVVRRAMAVPSTVRHIRTTEDFKYATALMLLRNRDLSLISVWSPGFLLLILDAIQGRLDSLIKDIHDGDISLQDRGCIPLPSSCLRPQRRRARDIERHSRHRDGDFCRAVWPLLHLVSCWAEGPSADGAREIRRRLPFAHLQGKGLCATEGIVTIPVASLGGSVPAYTSHFLEFLPLEGGDALCCDQLAPGQTYRVVLTNGGGLYRYALGDLVKVDGFAGPVPVLSFVGRDDVLDLTGEKLHRSEILETVRSVLDRARIAPQFRLFAPEGKSTPPGYVLFIQFGEETAAPCADVLLEMETWIDASLRRNYHYRYSRDLGQLAAPRVFVIRANGNETYYRRLIGDGMRAGDIKPAEVDRRDDWSSWFQGSYARQYPRTESPGPGATA